MKIKFLVLGKTAFPDVKVGEDRYSTRLQHYCSFERVEIPDVKNPKALSQDQLKKKEGELILAKVTPTDYLILMDENGLHQSSVEFAQWLDKKQMSVNGNLLFVIGGAYGFSESVYERANAKLSLSKMTFSHQMVRMIFLEQLYRAYSILKGEPYHHS
jgi:23S rRNA (pseudouridine1915-N3)-methyltransferase